MKLERGGYYGIDVEPDGAIIVVRHTSAGAPSVASYPRSNAGYQAVQDEIRASGWEPHVCMPSGPDTLPLAQALTGVRGIKLTLVPASAIDPAANEEQVARYLAQLAVELT